MDRAEIEVLRFIYEKCAPTYQTLIDRFGHEADEHLYMLEFEKSIARHDEAYSITRGGAERLRKYGKD